MAAPRRVNAGTVRATVTTVLRAKIALNVLAQKTVPIMVLAVKETVLVIQDGEVLTALYLVAQKIARGMENAK